MKVEELMIGDWVQITHHHSPKPIVKVKQVDLIDFCDALKQIYPRISYDPIRITPEIMEKNGFVKVPHEYEYPECQCWTNDVDGSYSFEIVADEHRKPYILGNGDMGDYEWVNFECKYLHELQHALRLTGIRKEINL